MNIFEKILTENILAFWMTTMQDHENGGFYGKMDGNNVLYSNANKGAILNMRILWTFASAYRILRKKEYLETAQKAFDYITEFFIDKTHQGVYWEIDYQGNPFNTKKQIYAQGFALYAFSEFYRATGNEQALMLAKDFFYLIEKCRDDKSGGYFEAYTRDWKPIEDMRLSEKDANEKKTMNTHLHLLEPYTNLCRIWKDEQVLSAQKNMIRIFADRILDKKTHHLNLFFDEEWNLKSTTVSYGHDIESSWLLFEAAAVSEDKELKEEIKSLSLKIADAAAEGILPDGSLSYEKKEKHLDAERHWWVQAEAVVGFMYAYKNSGKIEYKEKARKVWEYIRHKMIDFEKGEWYWSILANGTVNREEDKAGFWKCPYHNGRMCLEMIEHFNDIRF